mgnify:FL=1|tara:strand:+ start:26 stop:748 length:723 start_codon:yes stop_codon:yes gene_type:complete
MSEFKFPTELVELPSKGLIYPEDHPLRKGTVEIKYMTAKEEDILTNQNYIEKGTVLEKLLESLVIGNINLKDIFPGDKNAILIASRILGYGSEYKFMYNDTEHTVDLSELKNKPFDESLINSNGNFEFILPKSENKVEIKLLRETDEEKINEELKGLKKINKSLSADVTTRLKHMIVSIEGKSDKSEIKTFVENYLLAQDARSLRKFVQSVSPDVDMNYTTDSGEEVAVPINLNFFWPDL